MSTPGEPKKARGRPPLGLVPEPVTEGFPGRVSFVKSAAAMRDAPSSTLAEVAFCGRSNVGKSSLINTLCNRRQLARVSTTPGRTRLINFFDVQGRVMLVDLPGFGFATGVKAEVAAWGETIRGYLDDRRQLALTLLLFDERREPEREDAAERPARTGEEGGERRPGGEGATAFTGALEPVERERGGER